MQHPIIHRISTRACGVALLAALAPAAHAGPGEPAAARLAAARALFRADNTVGANGPSARPTAQPGAGADANRLDAQRGGTDTRNDMHLDGSVAGNSAVNVATGANSIDAGSFANMTGIPVVIQNTGANVLIQNATIINLRFQ